MLKNNKIYITLFLVFIILFFTCSSVFAVSGNTINISDDVNYDFVMNESNGSVVNLKNSIINDKRYKTGDYYYFITYNYGDNCYNSYLIKKSVLSGSLSIVFGGWHEGGYDHFFINISESNLLSTGDLIRVSGKNGWEINKFENSSNTYYGIILSGQVNISSHTITFPFATDYTGNVVRNCTDGSEKVFFEAPVQLTQMAEILAEAEPERTMEEILGILPVILIILVSLIGLRKALQLLFNFLRKS